MDRVNSQLGHKMLLFIRGLLLAAAFQAAEGSLNNEHVICESISIPECQSALPYNRTRFPNAVGNPSQEHAKGSMQKLGSSRQHSNCSKDALFFVCSLFLPICITTDMEQTIILPCRSLCETVRRDCEDKIGGWPKEAKCEEMPEYSDGICINPDSFVSASKTTPRTHIDNTTCQGKVIVDYDAYASRRYHYVIKYKVLVEQRGNGETILTGKVGRVLKQSNLAITKGQRLKIWSHTNSTCPAALVLGEYYAIAGYEDASSTKLLLSSESFIEHWSDQTLKKIRKWQRREREHREEESRKRLL